MISSLPVQYGYRGQSGNLDASRELVYGIRNFWRSTHPVLTGQQLARTAPGTAWTGSELGYDQQRTVADISRLKPGRTTSTSADHDQSFISVRTQPHHFGRTKANCLLIFPSFHSTIISLRSLLVFTTWVIFVDFPYPTWVCYWTGAYMVLWSTAFLGSGFQLVQYIRVSLHFCDALVLPFSVVKIC
jgi:hypothetical protein